MSMLLFETIKQPTDGNIEGISAVASEVPKMFRVGEARVIHAGMDWTEEIIHPINELINLLDSVLPTLCTASLQIIAQFFCKRCEQNTIVSCNEIFSSRLPSSSKRKHLVSCKVFAALPLTKRGR